MRTYIYNLNANFITCKMNSRVYKYIYHITVNYFVAAFI